MSFPTYTLSPSDFAFLWNDCPRCFYLKVKHGVTQPRSPMPSVFNVIDATMKQRLNEVPITDFVSGAPESKVFNHDGRVLSKVYESRFGIGLKIKGIYDTVLELAEGDFALVDLKTIKASPKLASTYSRQLHAYAWAMENSSIEENKLFPVSQLGLITFEPGRFTSRSDGSSALVGKNTWVQVERNDEQFLSFMNNIAEMLASETCPGSGKYCPICQYLDRISKFNEDDSRFKIAV